MMGEFLLWYRILPPVSAAVGGVNEKLSTSLSLSVYHSVWSRYFWARHLTSHRCSAELKSLLSHCVNVCHLNVTWVDSGNDYTEE